jgi:hypothetical protein
MLHDRGYPGTAVQVRRYVGLVRPRTRTEAYLRLETLPASKAKSTGATSAPCRWAGPGEFSLLRAGPLLVARRLRSLRPRPDPGELPPPPRRGLRRPGRHAPHAPLRQPQECRPRARGPYPRRDDRGRLPRPQLRRADVVPHRAADVGPACSDFIERLLGDRPLDRLRSAQGILRLASATAPPGWKPPAPARSRSASIATTP